MTNSSLVSKQSNPFSGLGELFLAAAMEGDARVTERIAQRNKAVGSPAAAPSLSMFWTIRAGQLPAEAPDRAAIFGEIDQAFSTESVLETACCLGYRSAVGDRGFTVNVIPVVKSRRAEYVADVLKGDVYPRLIEDHFDPARLGDAAYNLGRYNNVPTEIIVRDRRIAEVNLYPPHLFAKNVDERMRFRPGAPDAYIQYDLSSWNRIPGAQWSEAQMVWGSINVRVGELYGMPPAVAVLVHVNALTQGYESLHHGRRNAVPEKVYPAGEADGTPFDSVRLAEFETQLTPNRQARGETVTNPYIVVNGGTRDPSMLAASTDYFSSLTDLEARDLRICSAFGVPAHLVLPFPRMTADLFSQLVDWLYQRQSDVTTQMFFSWCRPILRTAAKVAGLDPSLVRLEPEWSARKQPTRLLQEAMSAVTWSEGASPVIDKETASRVASSYLSRNAEQVLERLAAQVVSGGNRTSPPELNGDVVTREPQLALVDRNRKRAGQDKLDLERRG